MAPLKYPGDLAEYNADFVEFKFFNYKPPYKNYPSDKEYLEAYNTSITFSNPALDTASGYETILLYMPEDISTSSQGSWGGREFGPLAPIALAAAGPVMNAGPGGVVAAGQKAMGQLGGMMNGGVPYVGASLVARAMNSIPGFGGGVTANDILASTRGQILNPNTEVLYQGPQLRTFSLNFKMVPRTASEATIIQNICKQFKKASLPTGASGNEKNMIGVPKVVQVTFMSAPGNNKKAATKNKWISQFKACALGGVDINYTPDGSWSTYEDGSPVATQLTLQFQELKLIYEQDVDSGY